MTQETPEQIKAQRDELLAGNGGKTGWPPGLLQDDCKGLSRWLSTRLDAKATLTQTPKEPKP